MDYATNKEILEAYENIKDLKPGSCHINTAARNKPYNQLSIKVLKTAMLTHSYVPKLQRTYFYIAYRAKILTHPILKHKINHVLTALHRKLDINGIKAMANGKAKQIAANNKYRASKKNAVVPLTHWDKKYIKNIYQTAQWLSTFCKPYHVDHIIPLAKGGKHHPDNLQILPSEINIAKSDKLDFYNK